GGRLAGAGFAVLAVFTEACVALGWKAAVQRRFAEHRRWMARTFVLLCSAVTIRLLGGWATIYEVESLWFDPLAAWACWVVPLAAFELATRAGRTSRRVMRSPAAG